MHRLTAFDLYPDDSVLYVYDSALDFGSLIVGAEYETQGFAGHPNSYRFPTLGECFNLKIEVWLAYSNESEQGIILREDTIRAVMVPFSKCDYRSRVVVTHIANLVELFFRLTSAPFYALVFEIKLRNDPEYLNSTRYQEYQQQGFTEECCYLNFYAREEPIEPAILRADNWEVPPYLLNRYTRVVDTVPLRLIDQPTRSEPW